MSFKIIKDQQTLTFFNITDVESFLSIVGSCSLDPNSTPQQMKSPLCALQYEFERTKLTLAWHEAKLFLKKFFGLTNHVRDAFIYILNEQKKVDINTYHGLVALSEAETIISQLCLSGFFLVYALQNTFN